MSDLVIYCPSCGLHWLLSGPLRGVRAMCTACEQSCEYCRGPERCPQAEMHGIADMDNAVRIVRGRRRA